MAEEKRGFLCSNGECEWSDDGDDAVVLIVSDSIKKATTAEQGKYQQQYNNVE